MECKKFLMDSSTLQLTTDDIDRNINANDTIRITNSTIRGYYTGTHQAVSQYSPLPFHSTRTLFENCHFDSVWIHPWVGPIRIERSIIGNCLDLTNLIEDTLYLSHCIFSHLYGFRVNVKYSVSNCIIDTLTFGIVYETQYYSPLKSNIIEHISNPMLRPGSPVVSGLLVNIQVNRNGDSCDLWNNIKGDPQIVDWHNGIVSANSPAIRAASDSTNIGCYQGSGVGIDRGEAPVLSRTYLNLSNEPNPFSNFTNIDFVVPVPGHVTLRVCSITGRSLVTLLDNSLSKGMHQIRYDAANLPNGIYIAKLIVGNLKCTKQLLLVK